MDGVSGQICVRHGNKGALLCIVPGSSARRSEPAEVTGRRAHLETRVATDTCHKRNGNRPDYDGLHVYVRHMGDQAGMISSQTFDRHVAQELKDTASLLEQ